MFSNYSTPIIVGTFIACRRYYHIPPWVTPPLIRVKPRPAVTPPTVVTPPIKITPPIIWKSNPILKR